ncbi:MAG: putative Ig domain-containing protein, partial [Planctomycetes bacterium]|nr:putative Ig domain-containing protein [Planctomycetota bacterium]
MNWSIASGSLPAGLSLNGATGAISGVPTSIGTPAFSVAATDSTTPSADYDEQSLSITIAADLTVTTASLPNGIVGTLYSQTLVAAGGNAPVTWALLSGTLPAGLSLSAAGGTPPYAWSIPTGSPGFLPAGLSLNTTTGVISGTPTGPSGSDFVDFAVTDSGAPPGQHDETDAAITIATSNALQVSPGSPPNGVVGTSYSFTVPSTGGNAPVTWSVGAGSLPAGLTLAAATGVISGTPTASGGSAFTVAVTDSTPSPGPDYDQAPRTITIAPDLSVTTAALANGIVGSAYSETLALAGGNGPFTWTMVSGTLPAGLTISAGGVISGTPTLAGSSPFTVRAVDSTSPSPDTADKALSIAIAADLAVTTASLPNGIVGTAYSQTLTSTGGNPPVTWSISSGALPAGLTLNSATGLIGGTPTTGGVASFTAQATDSTTPTADTAGQPLSLTIAA